MVHAAHTSSANPAHSSVSRAHRMPLCRTTRYQPGSAEIMWHVGQKARLSSASSVVEPPHRLPDSTIVNGWGSVRAASTNATAIASSASPHSWWPPAQKRAMPMPVSSASRAGRALLALWLHEGLPKSWASVRLLRCAQARPIALGSPPSHGACGPARWPAPRRPSRGLAHAQGWSTRRTTLATLDASPPRRSIWARGVMRGARPGRKSQSDASNAPLPVPHSRNSAAGSASDVHSWSEYDRQSAPCTTSAALKPKSACAPGATPFTRR